MIKEFRGQYRWLSNFAPVQIYREGRKYGCVEAAYMSCKSSDEKWKNFCVDTDNNPGVIKKASKVIELVPGWEEKKVPIMTDLLHQKFSASPYKKLLLSTGDEHIQEGNYWGDTFWGVCLKTDKGENKLGELLMELRTKLNKIRKTSG